MVRYTGHTPTGEDLKISTPSVHKEKARLNELEQKHPGACNFCMIDPSQISRRVKNKKVCLLQDGVCPKDLHKKNTMNNTSTKSYRQVVRYLTLTG